MHRPRAATSASSGVGSVSDSTWPSSRSKKAAVSVDGGGKAKRGGDAACVHRPCRAIFRRARKPGACTERLRSKKTSKRSISPASSHVPQVHSSIITWEQ